MERFSIDLVVAPDLTTGTSDHMKILKLLTKKLKVERVVCF
jgi:hypothetical protein